MIFVLICTSAFGGGGYFRVTQIGLLNAFSFFSIFRILKKIKLILERRRKKHPSVASLMHPTRKTRNRTGNLGMCPSLGIEPATFGWTVCGDSLLMMTVNS